MFGYSPTNSVSKYSGGPVNSDPFGLGAGPVINPDHLPKTSMTNLSNSSTGSGSGGAGWKVYANNLIYDTLMAKGAGVALVAGVGAVLMLQTNTAETINFAALAALSSSVGDAALIGLGIEKKIDSYLKPNSYFDASDFVGTAAMFALFASMESIPLDAMLTPILIAGVAGASGPKLIGSILKEAKINKPGN